MSNLESFNVYDRIEIKCREGIYDLDYDERQVAEDLLLDSYSSRITKLSDELLMQELEETGAI